MIGTAAFDVVVHEVAVFDAGVQFVHSYVVGEPTQLAVSVMDCPTPGVVLVVLIWHTGGPDGTAPQSTVSDAWGLLPLALVAITEYVLAPTLGAESVQVDDVDAHPVQV